MVHVHRSLHTGEYIKSCIFKLAHLYTCSILLGAGIYAIENINNNITKLPVDNAFTLVAMPIKITGGSGSPARIIAFC